MLNVRTRIILFGWLLGLGLLSLAPPACSRSGLMTARPGGAGSSGSGDPTQILPSDGGSCPGTTSLCGAGARARCYALDGDATNCGACGRICTPGVACSAGTCQQPKCTGPVSFQQIASFPSILATPTTLLVSGDATEFEGYVGADINRDGRLDLIEYNLGGDLVIWLGQSDGTFVVSTSYSTTGSASTWALPGYAAVGDFNEDGLADLAVTKPNSDTIEIRPGLPGGGLGGRPGPPVSRLLMADLDGDGHLDVINSHTDKNGSPTGFTALRGRGDGTFATAGNYAITDGNGWRLELGDWDGDGTLDLIGIGTTVDVLLGKGDGTFAEPQRCALSFGFEPFAFADLNDDGKLDAVWVLWADQSVTTVLGSGGCSFTPRTDHPQSFQPGPFGIGDLSGNGVPDLVLPGDKGGTVLLLGKGDGSFVAQPELDLDMSGLTLFIADVTDDGIPDIVSTGERGIVVFANTCTH